MALLAGRPIWETMMNTGLHTICTKACSHCHTQISTLALASEVFAIEHDSTTVILTPLVDLRTLDYAQVAAGAKELLEDLNRGAVQNVVIDFRHTDRSGSVALGFFIFLWKKVRACGGKMAVCNVADHALAKLRVMNLDRLWLVCASKKEALGLVRKRLAQTVRSDN
jgi:anti-anti-sigma regulatory factor